MKKDALTDKQASLIISETLNQNTDQPATERAVVDSNNTRQNFRSGVYERLAFGRRHVIGNTCKRSKEYPITKAVYFKTIRSKIKYKKQVLIPYLRLKMARILKRSEVKKWLVD